MAMKKQMDLFEPVERGFDEGGLMDEGGSVDPVSGNEVPTGSTQEEVRDDIPAQLSEGEFVLPADVVRYHGLEKIMELRDEAKAGLQKMEAMGQMGNSEEATLPDNVPFSMDDLELEEDGVAEYQVGGFVPQVQAPGVTYQQSQFTGYQPQISQPVTQPSTTPTYQAPTQQFTPTQNITTPSFSAFTQPTSVTYYHADGRTIQVPVDANGNPLIPVPAGFSATKPTAAAPTTPTQNGMNTGIIQSEDSDPNPMLEQQKAERQELINNRKTAAKNLGYTKEQTTLEALAPFVPGLSMFVPTPEVGTILADGSVADGRGNSYDPITGNKVMSGQGFLGVGASVLDELTGNNKLGVLDDETFKISKKASEMGMSPASIAGLKTVKGEESIQDLLDKAGTTTTPSATVETARVTEEGAVGEVAEKAAEKFTETPEELDTRVNNIVDYMNTITKGDVKVVSREPGGNVVVEGPDALGTGNITTVVTPQGDVIRQYDGSDEVSDVYKRTDLASPSRAAAIEAGEEKRDETSARVSAAQRRTADIPRQTAAERADEEAAEQEGGTAFDDYGRDFDRNYDNARNKGYSDSGAREYASNKTDADREAREQTGNSKSSAVTSSDGTAVRSSSGSVVTNTPRDDGGDDDDDGGKIVCTAMNNAYGFGSFRQTIWLKHSVNMHPAYQKGYHRIFKPLIKFAYKGNKWYNMAVRKTLEGIARRRTADIWMQQRGKRHPIGAIERAILEPICYIVGKIK